MLSSDEGFEFEIGCPLVPGRVADSLLGNFPPTAFVGRAIRARLRSSEQQRTDLGEKLRGGSCFAPLRTVVGSLLFE